MTGSNKIDVFNNIDPLLVVNIYRPLLLFGSIASLPL